MKSDDESGTTPRPQRSRCSWPTRPGPRAPAPAPGRSPRDRRRRAPTQRESRAALAGALCRIARAGAVAVERGTDDHRHHSRPGPRSRPRTLAAPPWRSDASAASARRTTSRARLRLCSGRSPVRIARTNSATWRASGSSLESCGERMSPFGRRGGTRRSLRVPVDDSAVEDLHGLRAAVLVDDHLLRADDDRAAQLARRQPAQLDVGDDAGGEVHRRRTRRRRCRARSSRARWRGSTSGEPPSQ